MKDGNRRIDAVLGRQVQRHGYIAGFCQQLLCRQANALCSACGSGGDLDQRGSLGRRIESILTGQSGKTCKGDQRDRLSRRRPVDLLHGCGQRPQFFFDLSGSSGRRQHRLGSQAVDDHVQLACAVFGRYQHDRAGQLAEGEKRRYKINGIRQSQNHHFALSTPRFAQIACQVFRAVKKFSKVQFPLRGLEGKPGVKRSTALLEKMPYPGRGLFRFSHLFSGPVA